MLGDSGSLVSGSPFSGRPLVGVKRPTPQPQGIRSGYERQVDEASLNHTRLPSILLAHEEEIRLGAEGLRRLLHIVNIPRAGGWENEK